jgi:hypothetical protein
MLVSKLFGLGDVMGIEDVVTLARQNAPQHLAQDFIVVNEQDCGSVHGPSSQSISRDDGMITQLRCRLQNESSSDFSAVFCEISPGFAQR